MGEFEPTTLGRLLSFANGRSSPPRADNQPYRVYGSNGVIGFADQANATEGTIIVGRVGSYCGSLYFSEDACWVTDNAIRATARDNNCPKFLFYLLGTLDLNNWRAGSGQPLLNQDILSHIPAWAPKPCEQHAIASILGALDDKIDLNHRINETLEAMARAIFKDWFIDFGPTRAKIEGRALYLVPEIWSLLPDRLDDDGKPESWSVDSLETIADLNWGDTNTTKQSYSKSGYVAFSASGPDGFLPYYDFDRSGVVLSAIGANCGMSWLATGKWSCIKNTIRFWPKAAGIPIEYLFLATYGTEFWPKRGSAQPFISQSDARNVRLLVPDSSILRAFAELVHPLYEKIAQGEAERAALAHTRDLLLPKLISGEIRIKDAAKITEPAL
jgi:type I restriction enzyme S subunit